MNNILPQLTFVYDRYSKASPTRKASVEMRITYQRRQKYLSTGIQLYPKQWRNGTVVGCPDALQLNQMLSKMLMEVRQAIVDMVNEGNLDIISIPERLNRMNGNGLSFLEFCKQRIPVREYKKSPDIHRRYYRFLERFTQWGKITSFEDVTEKNIIAYDKYLTETGIKPNSKWSNYHRFLNSFIIDAVNEGYLTRNPYKWLNIDRHQDMTVKRYLTPDEFHRIRTAQMPTESLERVRDVFVFQTYTCLSYTDLREFDASALQEVKGMKVYTGNRAKTRKGFTVPLVKPALFILEKYGGKLPVISNVKYNEYLKIVAQAAGIDKPVSTHWARHTGATLLLNEGIDMKVVSKICGHSSMRITEQVYAKLLDETVVDAISELEKGK